MRQNEENNTSSEKSVFQPGELYNRMKRSEEPDESLYNRMKQSVEKNKNRYSRVKEEVEARKGLIERLKKALGPIIPGLMIDLADLVTFGLIGLSGLGLVVGGVAGYWIGCSFNLPIKKRLIGSLIAGIYCTLPFTGILPVGTLIGAYVRFSEHPENSDDPVVHADQEN